MTNGEWLTNEAAYLNIPKRTLEQVKKALSRAKKCGADVSMAKLMAIHGRLEDDAKEYVANYVS